MKLYGKLLLSMAAAGALALLALAVTLNWRLGQGFVDFVNAADAERLPPVAAALAEHYRETGGWDRLRAMPGRTAWRALLHRARELDEAQAERASGTDGAPAESRREGDRRQRRERGHRHIEPWAPLWSRLGVFDAQRATLLGRHGFERTARRIPIEVDGRTVGWVGLVELREVRSRLGEAFLADQRRGLLWASGVMLLILGASAALLARAWTRRIARIGGVTRRLAGGDFQARVGPAGRDEIGALAGDIDFLAQSLQAADAGRRRWMADAAHELRTPLAVLKGELEALLDGIRPLDREAIGSLHAEAGHLGALIDELRELAMADVGALDYRMETLDLGALVEDCLAGSAGRIAQLPLQLDWQRPDRPVPVRGDARRLRQLVENLLENTLRYTDPGGRLRIALAQVGDGAELAWDDSAPGVPEAMLPQLFEPFVRADPARARVAAGAGEAVRGSGLGLAIGRRIVEGHGGRITAQASALGGLALRVWLPVAGTARP
jgi:two-component system sensor histidine kinase BaeS